MAGRWLPSLLDRMIAARVLFHAFNRCCRFFAHFSFWLLFSFVVCLPVHFMYSHTFRSRFSFDFAALSQCLKRHEFINQASLTKKTNGPHSMRTKPNSSKKVISAATSASTAPSAMSSGESGSTGLGTKQGDQCSGSRYFDNHKMDIKSSEESVTPNDIGHSPAEAEDAVTDGNPQTSRRQNKLGKLPSFIPIG